MESAPPRPNPVPVTVTGVQRPRGAKTVPPGKPIGHEPVPHGSVHGTPLQVPLAWATVPEIVTKQSTKYVHPAVTHELTAALMERSSWQMLAPSEQSPEVEAAKATEVTRRVAARAIERIVRMQPTGCATAT